MPKGVANKWYTAEFKKQVVETMQKEKLSCCETARQFEKGSQELWSNANRIWAVSVHSSEQSWSRSWPVSAAVEGRSCWSWSSRNSRSPVSAWRSLISINFKDMSYSTCKPLKLCTKRSPQEPQKQWARPVSRSYAALYRMSPFALKISNTYPEALTDEKSCFDSSVPRQKNVISASILKFWYIYF